MEAYARVLTLAIPFFVVLIAIESLAAWRKGQRVNRGADTISSLSSGVTNVIKDVLGLSVAIISYRWMVSHLALFTLESTFLLYLTAFLVKDFAGYWVHRLEHEVNVLWNRHIIHHSSEEFNLSCALRQSISSVLSFAALFMVPAAVLGVPAEVFAVVAPLHLFAQFWYHTRLIGRLGWLEYIIVTPSHHRVHHAMNPAYLDKNYGQILIIWDKLFGTFQEERADIAPVYGVKRPVRTWNPILINFQHLGLLLRDAWRARSWWDKCRIWFMPNGWRPADVARHYPVDGVDALDHFEKYDTHPGPALLAWAWAQLAFTLALMFWLFLQIGQLPLPWILAYGAFLYAAVFSFTSALDRHPQGCLISLGWLVWGWGMLVLRQGDWFGLGAAGALFVALWTLLSWLAQVYLYRKEPPLTPSASGLS